MKRALLSVIISLILCVVTKAQVNVLPLGNSITEGDSAHNSYRRALHQLLVNENFAFNFVGSDTSNHLGPPPNADFDMDHEGHWGWRIDELLNGRSGEGNLSSWLQGYSADAVLLHAGTNDLFQNQGVSGTIAELEQLIDTLRKYQPAIVIFLAKLIPTDASVQRNIWITRFNDSLPSLVTRKFAFGSPIILVDQNSGFNPALGADTYDRVHPNLSGEHKMALKWKNALLAYYRPLDNHFLYLLKAERKHADLKVEFEIQSEFDLSALELELLTASGTWKNYANLDPRSSGLHVANISDFLPGDQTIRLKSHSLTGNLKVSNALFISDADAEVLLRRGSDNYVLRLNNHSPGAYTLRLYDPLGRVTWIKSGITSSQLQEITIEATPATPGILIFSDSSGQYSFRLLPLH